ncbi:hypothetical protein P8452_28702 [Trifolium repens]|nr:hypothetical protein P8452_28702 [Trifolium repens]
MVNDLGILLLHEPTHSTRGDSSLRASFEFDFAVDAQNSLRRVFDVAASCLELTQISSSQINSSPKIEIDLKVTNPKSCN